MEYYNEDQLYKYFKDTIKKESTKKMDRLRLEIDQIKERELKRIDLEVRRQIDWTLGGRLKDLKKEHQTKLNQIAINIDMQLMALRAKMVKEIFDDVEKRIIKFVKTKEYEKLIESKIKRVSENFKNNDFYFLIAKNDAKTKEIITKIFQTKKVEIKETDEITIGGFIINFNNGVEIDESFDTKLTDQKEDFIEKSRLFIKK